MDLRFRIERVEPTVSPRPLVLGHALGVDDIRAKIALEEFERRFQNLLASILYQQQLQSRDMDAAAAVTTAVAREDITGKEGLKAYTSWLQREDDEQERDRINRRRGRSNA